MGKITATLPDGTTKQFDWTSPNPPTGEDVDRLIQGGASTWDQIKGTASYAKDFAMAHPWEAVKSTFNAPFEAASALVSDSGAAAGNAMGRFLTGDQTSPDMSYGEAVETVAPKVAQMIPGTGPLAQGMMGLGIPGGEQLAGVNEGISKFLMGQIPNLPAMGVGFGAGALGKAATAFFAATGIEGASEMGKAAFLSFEKEGLSRKTMDLIAQAGGNVAMAAFGLKGLKDHFSPKTPPTPEMQGQPTVRVPSREMLDAAEMPPPPDPPFNEDFAPQVQERVNWTPEQEASYRKQFEQREAERPVTDRDFSVGDETESVVPVEQQFHEAPKPMKTNALLQMRDMAEQLGSGEKVSGIPSQDASTSDGIAQFDIDLPKNPSVPDSAFAALTNQLVAEALNNLPPGLDLSAEQLAKAQTAVQAGRVAQIVLADHPQASVRGLTVPKRGGENEIFIQPGEIARSGQAGMAKTAPLDLGMNVLRTVAHEIAHALDVQNTLHDTPGNEAQRLQLETQIFDTLRNSPTGAAFLDTATRPGSIANEMLQGHGGKQSLVMAATSKMTGGKNLKPQNTEPYAMQPLASHTKRGLPPETPRVGNWEEEFAQAPEVKEKFPWEEVAEQRQTEGAGPSRPTPANEMITAAQTLRTHTNSPAEGAFPNTSTAELRESLRNIPPGSNMEATMKPQIEAELSRRSMAGEWAQTLKGSSLTRAAQTLDAIAAGKVAPTRSEVTKYVLAVSGRGQIGNRTRTVIDGVMRALEEGKKAAKRNGEEGSISIDALTAPFRLIGRTARDLVQRPGELLTKADRGLKTLDLASRASQIKTTVNNIVYGKVLSTSEAIFDAMSAFTGNKEAKSRFSARNELNNPAKMSTMNLIALLADATNALNPSVKSGSKETRAQVDALQQITKNQLSTSNQERLWHLTGTGGKVGGAVTPLEHVSQKLMMASLLHDRVSRVAQLFLHLKPLMDEVGAKNFTELQQKIEQNKGDVDFITKVEDKVNDAANIALRRSYAAQAPTKAMANLIKSLDQMPGLWIALKYNNATFANGMMGLIESVPLLEHVPGLKALSPRHKMANEKPALVKDLAVKRKEVNRAQSEYNLVKAARKAKTATTQDVLAARKIRDEALKAHRVVKDSLRDMRERGVVPKRELQQFYGTAAMAFGAMYVYRKAQLEKGKDTGEDWYRPRVAGRRIDLRAGLGPFGWAAMLGDYVARSQAGSTKYDTYPGFKNIAQEAEAATGSRFGGYTPSDLWNTASTTMKEGDLETGASKLKYEVARGLTLGGPLLDAARQIAQNMDTKERTARRADLPQEGDNGMTPVLRGLESNIPFARSKEVPAYSPFSGKMKSRPGLLSSSDLGPLESFVEAHYAKLGDVTKFLVGPSGDRAYDKDLYGNLREMIEERVLPVISDPEWTEDEKVLFVQREMASIRQEAADAAKMNAMEMGRKLPKKVEAAEKERQRQEEIKEENPDLFPKRRPKSDYKMNRGDKQDFREYIMGDAP